MTPDQIKAVAHYSGTDFGSWLLNGFDSLVNRSERFAAFAPIHALIGYSRDQTVVDDLKDLFQILGSDGQRCFKEGMKDALSRTLVESPMPTLSLVDSLLLLAQAVRATDVLPEIEKLVSDSFLTRFPEEDRISLFARAFETVRTYRGYHDVARIILDRFAPHVLFRPGYGLRALVACLVSDNSSWRTAFARLRPRLAASRVRLTTELQRELRDKIDAKDVQRAIRRGDLRLCGNEDLGFGSDDWFIRVFGLHAGGSAVPVQIAPNVLIAASTFEDLNALGRGMNLVFPKLCSTKAKQLPHHVER